MTRMKWFERRGFVLLVETCYLVILFALAFIFFTNRNALAPLPNSFGSLPVGVLWFGALGAVVISLSGIFDHRTDWDPSWNYWHYTRPLIGVTLAIISVVIFQSGILAVGSRPTLKDGAPSNLLYYLIAFVVGYREEVFRELIKRFADVILTSAAPPPVPTIKSLTPPKGAAAGATSVVIAGSGFTGTTSVKFGSTVATSFHVDSDSQITAVAPAGTGSVSIVITAKGGSATIAGFAYE